jgi:hypothetical protein
VTTVTFTPGRLTSAGQWADDAETETETETAPPPRRRWAGAAAALLLTVCGAAGAVWLASDDRPQVEVVALARPLHRGQAVTRDDLAVVRLAAEGGALRLATPSTAAEAVLGRSALIDLPAGTLVNPEMVGSAALPAGHVSLGVRLGADGLPSSSPRPGETVDVVGSDPTTGQAVMLARSVRVAEVEPQPGGARGGDRVVYLVVPEADAQAVATAALSERGLRLLGSAGETP